MLYKNVFAGRAPDFREVRPEDWPDSFRRFSPRYVGAYQDGVVLALTKAGSTEAGLYVIPQHMERVPKGSARASFQALAPGVYWYTFDN